MHAAVSQAAERDRDIVELLRQGGRDRAFEELLRRYEGKVYRLCCALLGDHAQAEDAAQESFVRVWKALERYDGRASLSSWIYAITRNRCLTALEKRRSLDSLDELGEDGEVGLYATGNPGVGLVEQLRGLVDLLPERLRRTLVLYYYEERSVSEVALMLGCPEGTVKTMLFRARGALSDILKRRGLDDPAYWQEDAQ
ncbi:MAG TPA: RNA polymerase sigma factor [Steroidobacteraceae bacterium]|jgi:RNA polymerase sigma-70 factor (ECF subfamily)|nr:RNA polymerase sigma factor [Steroidobacteraceae bacterium]